MIYERIVQIISEQLDMDPDKITMESCMADGLGADSLDMVEVIMAVEDEFDVEITDDAAESMNTVGDLVRYVEENQ